jgi:hypothetical protein
MFNGNREKAIARDNQRCVKCGITRTEHEAMLGLDLTVHHVDGKGSTTPETLRNNSLDNLQTLCSRCHGRTENTFNKLTDTQVINIRHMQGEVDNLAIAKMYGLSRQYVGELIRRKWRANI